MQARRFSKPGLFGLICSAVALLPLQGAAQSAQGQSTAAEVRQGLRLNDLRIHDRYIVAHEPSQTNTAQLSYVTDGNQTYRTKTSHLLMLWSSYENGSYVETVARSASGRLEGPWVQLDPLVREDSGHGMLFETFDGQLMMVLHRPFDMPLSRALLFDMEDLGDNLRVMRARPDLYGPEAGD